MPKDAGSTGQDERQKRLAEALRENLARRKAQARGRRAGEADPRHGLAAASADGTDDTKQKPESGG